MITATDTGLGTSTGAAPVRIPIDAGIPQSFASPMVEAFNAPWEESQAAALRAANEKRRATQQKLDAALLNPDEFFQKNPIRSPFVTNPEREKKALLNQAFIRHQLGGERAPANGFGYDLLRRDLAFKLFDGRGAASDEEFHAEIVKDAGRRRDTKTLVESLQVSAFDDAMLPSDQAPGFAAWREKAKASPGYEARREADYLETWHDVRTAAAERVEEYREPLVQVWRAFRTDGNITAAAFDAWKQLPEDRRGEFLDAIAIRAKALPEEERRGFWANLSRSTGLSVRDFYRAAGESAGAAALGVDYRSYAPAGVAIPPPEGLDANFIAESNQQSRKEFQARRNFAADIRRIAREDYDPIKSAFGDGGKPGFWEGAAYAIPGVFGSSVMMAVPLVGAGVMAASMEGQAYEQLRGRMLEAGLSDEDATRNAEGLAPFVAAPQIALEKVGFGIWSRKLPGFTAALDKLGDQITNRLVRGGVKTLAIGAAETGIETAQDLTSYAVQDIAAALSADVPQVKWSEALAGAWAQAPETFVTMLPLAILGAAGGLSRESRAAAFAASSPLQRRALGISDADSARIDAAAANGQNSINRAVDVAMANRNPASPEAQSAAQELRVQAASQARAAAALERVGYSPPRFTQTTDGISVIDGETGEEIGQSPDLSGAVRIARAHTIAMDDMTAEQVAYLGSMMESTAAAVEVDPDSAVEFRFAESFDPDQATPEMAARYAAQVALKEQAEGGTGDVARSVLGYSVTEFSQGMRNTVNRLFEGAAVTDVFHENFHGLRRNAHAKGTITRAQELAVLRGLDAVFAGKTTRDGTQLRFIPEGMTDEQVPETLIDEAISEIAEMEVLRTRKGKGKGRFGVSRGVISRNLTALAKLVAPEAMRTFKAFIDAVRARWGLSLTRALALKKAERDGKFDASNYQGFLDSLMGLDAQEEHDAGVREELNRILAMPDEVADDDIPFSIGRGATMPARDAEYMAAVGSGDMETAQRMVDEAAKGAGYDIGPVYHGTNAKFDAFDFGKALKSNDATYGRGFYFTTDPNGAKSAGSRVISAYLKLNNPQTVEDSWLNGEEATKRTNDLKSAGHDGIIVDLDPEEESDAQAGKFYVAFDPSQIKSADPVTYDANGNVIPLSQRFDSTKDSISFSLGPADVPRIMAGNALARVREPRRRTHAMSRIARDFDALRLQTERLLHLSGRRRSKAELRQEANARQDLAEEEKIGRVWAKYGQLLADDDLTKIKAQPVHAYLADPTSRLRGRLMSKAAAIKAFPDRYQLHRAGEYDGAEAVSRSVFGGQLMPDQAAQELYEAGLISDPIPDLMWEALLSEQKSVAGMRELLVKAQEEIRTAKQEAKQEANEWLATQAKDQETNFSPKQEIIRSLRMLDAILLALPPEVRGKIGGYTQMALITTDEARLAYLKDKLAKADKHLETFLKEQYGTEWTDLLRRARPDSDNPGERPTGRIAADAYDILRAAEAAMGLSFSEGEAEADRLEALADHEDTPADRAQVYSMQAQMVRLTANWTAADAARREQAVMEGERIYFGGLSALAIENSRRRERLGKLRDSAISGTGKTGKRMERETATRAAKGTRMAQAAQMAWEFMSFGQLVNVLFGEESAVAKWANAREIAASNQLEDAFQAKTNAMESMLESLAGSRFGGEKLRHRMQTVQTITVKDALGNEEKFTDSQAITFLLMWRQEDGRRHMSGVIDDSGNVVSTWGWDDASAAEVERQLSPEGRAMMAFLGDSYGTEYGRINEVFRRIWNVSMPRHKQYAPLSVMPSQAKSDTIMDPSTGESMGIGMTPGSLKNRSATAVAEPDFRDAFQVYLTHARQMEHFIAYGEFARDMLGVINRKETRNAITAAGGPYAAATLSKWVDYFAQGGIKDAAMGGALQQFFGGALGRLSSAMLIGRVSVLAMQSMQLVSAAYKMPLGAYLTRMGKLLSGRLGWGDAIRSEYIQRRLQEMPPVVRDAVRGLESGNPNRAKFLAARLGRTIAGADALFTAGTYAMLYDYHLKAARAAGVANPEATAHAEAERITDQIAQPTRAGARSWMELSMGGQPAFRALWNFASDPRQKLSLVLYQAMRRDKSGKEKTAAFARSAAITWAVGGILQATLRAIMRDLRDDEDDEVFDERHWRIDRLALQALTGPVGGMPFVGEIFESSTYAITGQFMKEGTMFSTIAESAGLLRKWGKGDADPLKDAETIFTGGAAVSGTSAAAASFMHVVRDAVGIYENFTGD